MLSIYRYIKNKRYILAQPAAKDPRNAGHQF
jgi:hypothetical protein